jgi:hypothetical protein
MTHYTLEIKKYNDNNEECDNFEISITSEIIAIIILVAIIIILIAVIITLIF